MISFVVANGRKENPTLHNRACTWCRDNLNDTLIAFAWSFSTSTRALGFNRCIMGHRCSPQEQTHEPYGMTSMSQLNRNLLMITFVVANGWKENPTLHIRTCTRRWGNLNDALIAFLWLFATSTHALGFKRCIMGHRCSPTIQVTCLQPKSFHLDLLNFVSKMA